MPSISLTIEKLVHGGFGLAYNGRATVFVRNVLPGEKVLANPVGKHGGIPFFEPHEIIDSSSFRRIPACRFFGICGGCDWLFIDYEQQLPLKKNIFIESMNRIGKIASFPAPEVFASPEFEYRRRAQIKIDNNGHTGFFRRESNEVVTIGRCPLLTERINRLLEQFTLHPSSVPRGITNCKVIDGTTSLASFPIINGCTDEFTKITCGKFLFDAAGNDFVQSNRFLPEKLITWVASHCRGKSLVDLYGGIGYFSVMLSDIFERGLLIESDRNMVHRAQRNYSQNGISTMKAIAVATEKAYEQIFGNSDTFIVDPPRPGLSEKTRSALIRCNPKTIIYVSCDCATQARDAGYFVKNNGYTITASALFDFYPNTHHTETVLILQR